MWQSGGRVLRGGDLLVELTGQAVFRAENGPHLDAGGPEQQLQGRAPGRIDAGVIGDHPDPFAGQGRETVGGQDLDPRPDPVRPVAGAKPRHVRFQVGVS